MTVPCSPAPCAKQAALARAGRAERIAANDRTDPARTAALRRTAVIVSARAALSMQRFGAATSHASRLLQLPPPPDAAAAAAAGKEARGLLVDIQRRVAEVTLNPLAAASLSSPRARVPTASTRRRAAER